MSPEDKHGFCTADSTEYVVFNVNVSSSINTSTYNLFFLLFLGPCRSPFVIQVTVCFYIGDENMLYKACLDSFLLALQPLHYTGSLLSWKDSTVQIQALQCSWSVSSNDTHLFWFQRPFGPVENAYVNRRFQTWEKP